MWHATAPYRGHSNYHLISSYCKLSSVTGNISEGTIKFQKWVRWMRHGARDFLSLTRNFLSLARKNIKHNCSCALLIQLTCPSNFYFLKFIFHFDVKRTLWGYRIRQQRLWNINNNFHVCSETRKRQTRSKGNMTEQNDNLDRKYEKQGYESAKRRSKEVEDQKRTR